MPSGRTHDRITLWSLPGIAGLAYLLTHQSQLTLIVAGAFLFSGLMYGPDLDIYSVQYKRWGKLRWLWVPYQSSLKHRSWLSHGFIIGTVLRMLYLLVFSFAIALPAVAIAQLIIGFDWNWQQAAFEAISLVREYPQEAIALSIGLELGAMSHSISDWLGSAFKRREKRRKGSKKRQ
jgi:uncharacterized metal-binding protein